MPQRFNFMSPNLYKPEFRKLSTTAKLVEYGILNSPLRSTEGLWRQPLHFVAYEHGLETAAVESAIREELEGEFVSYDFKNECVLDRLALVWFPMREGTDKDGNPKPDNRIKSSLKHLEQISDSPLLYELYAIAKRHSPVFGLALADRFPFLATSPLTEAPSEGLKQNAKPPLEKRSAAKRSGEEGSGGLCARCDFNQVQAELPDGTKLCESCAKSNEAEPNAEVMNINDIKQAFNAEEVKYGTGGDAEW